MVVPRMLKISSSSQSLQKKNLPDILFLCNFVSNNVRKKWVAVVSAKKHKRQRRKRQSVTAKREKSQTPKVLTAILTLPNLT